MGGFLEKMDILGLVGLIKGVYGNVLDDNEDDELEL